MTEQCSNEWNDLVDAEGRFYAARARFMALPGRERDLTKALAQPRERGTALRVLLIMPPETSQRMMPILMEQASVGHADIALVREVIARVDRNWTLRNIEAIADTFLAKGEHEEYRRFAELYAELNAWEQLSRLLARCRAHPSEDIREIADDFSRRDSQQGRAEEPK